MDFGNTTTNIIRSGLVFNMDAANRKSYPKTGITWFDTINNNNGTISGASFETINNGIFDFDGSDDYIDCGDSDDLSFGDGSSDSAFSISAWIKMDSAVRFRICSKYDNNKWEYLFTTSGGKELVFNLYSQNTSNRIGRRTSSINSLVGSWAHICATYDSSGGSSGIKLYVNGAQADNLDNNSGTYVATQNNTAPFRIGTADLSHYANGQIANMQVYNRALSSTEVAQNYNALKSRFE